MGIHSVKSCFIAGERERKRDGGSVSGVVPSKKSKLVGGVLSRSSSVGGGSPVQSSSSAMSSDAWEVLALEVDPSELVTNVLDAADADDADKVVSI